VRTQAPLIDKPLIAKASAHRGGKPLVLLDLGLPRNFAADVGKLPNVFVNDLEALSQVVDHNLAARKKDVPRVLSIIGEEVDRLGEWQRGLSAGPLIAALRESVETMRQAEVERACEGLSDAERLAVDRATRAVVNKLLHGPMTHIKSIAKHED